jgi:hypothetical protein
MKTSSVLVSTVPAIDLEELVFVCDSRESLMKVVVGGLHDNAEDNQACGLVEVGQLSFIGAVEAVYVVLIEGTPVEVGLYVVQACNRSYNLAWPSPLDSHLVDPELSADVGLPEVLVREGFPGGTCTSPEPIVGTGEVLLTQAVE